MTDDGLSEMNCIGCADAGGVQVVIHLLQGLAQLVHSISTSKNDVLESHSIDYPLNPVPMPVPRLSGARDKMLRSLIFPT